MQELIACEPDFYRSMLVAVFRDGGPEFRHMVSGPRYLLWKKLLKQAIAAGLLRDDADPDAFAIVTSQLLFSNILEWANGMLGLDELEPLREALSAEYPECWQRIEKRRDFMRNTLGIRLHESVLPLSDTSGWLPPFAFSLNMVPTR